MLNNTCRWITGCLKPTNTNNLHLLADIVPADIRQEVASRLEMTKAVSDEPHLLHGCQPPDLESRKSFLSHVPPLQTSWEETRLQHWSQSSTDLGIPPCWRPPPWLRNTMDSVKDTQPPKNKIKTIKSCFAQMGLQDWHKQLWMWSRRPHYRALPCLLSTAQPLLLKRPGRDKVLLWENDLQLIKVKKNRNI